MIWSWWSQPVGLIYLWRARIHQYFITCVPCGVGAEQSVIKEIPK